MTKLADNYYALSGLPYRRPNSMNNHGIVVINEVQQFVRGAASTAAKYVRLPLPTF